MGPVLRRTGAGGRPKKLASARGSRELDEPEGDGGVGADSVPGVGVGAGAGAEMTPGLRENEVEELLVNLALKTREIRVARGGGS